MRYRGLGARLVLVLAALVLALPATARSLTDATGRTVEIPDRLARVLPAGQPAAVLLYVLAPEKMLVWPRKPMGPGAQFLTPAARALPEVGPMVLRNGQVNEAMLREMKPDLVVDYGSLTPGYVEAAERMQQKIGVPYILLDGDLARTAEMLRVLAPALDAGARGEMLAKEAERILALNAARVGAGQRMGTLRVYYSRSENGLATATARTHTTDVLRLMGLENVADAHPGDFFEVTRAELLAWRPQVIFAPNREDGKAFAAADWAELPAVAAHRVFAAPRPPFGWIDEPPSVNRLLGLLWVGHLLYPAAYPEDLRAEAKAFYRRFYQVEPSETQLDRLLPR
jgi:iron complex transport system substrate-binding protein